MSLTLKQVERLMRHEGFELVRQGAGGKKIWWDGFTRICTPHGDIRGFNDEKCLYKQLRNAKQKRLESGAVSEPTPFIPVKQESEPLKTTIGEAMSVSVLRRPSPEPRAVTPVPAPKPYVSPDPAPVAPAPRKKTHGHKKYDSATRFKVWGRIRELAKKGHGTPAIANIMRSEGVLLPDGETLIDSDYVSAALTRMNEQEAAGITTGTMASILLEEERERREEQAASEPAPEPAPEPAKVAAFQAAAVATPTKTVTALPAFVLEILTNPDFSAEKKVRLLLAYAED
jgi:hypothetical protein